jgi:hypothetical protein
MGEKTVGGRGQKEPHNQEDEEGEVGGCEMDWIDHRER